MRSTGNATPIQESKVPSSQVSGFVRNTLKGDLFEKKVTSVFGNNTMARFLISEQYCDNHPAWSGAFASRLRDTLGNSSILQYLSAELEEE